MKLYAISDLHLDYEVNRIELERLPAHPDDWLIVAGDTSNTTKHLRWALTILTDRFQQVLWVPGNHELWTETSDGQELTGVSKYNRLVDVCREYNVLTPEDPYVTWTGDGPTCILAPLFLLYDYTFRPDHVAREDALAWAKETGIMCNDERLLIPTPYDSREEWCSERLQYTEQRLQEASAKAPLVLINHFPLREDLVRLFNIPRFSLWCGTRATNDWHTQFPTKVVVSGHLHMRSTDYRDGVRFEEVSLGYPKHWKQSKGMQNYLREILPGPRVDYENAGPFWKF